MEQKRSWYVKDAEIRPGILEQSVTPPLHRVDLRQVPSALGVIIQCDGGNSDCSLMDVPGFMLGGEQDPSPAHVLAVV